jgi:hypothetical protein
MWRKYNPIPIPAFPLKGKEFGRALLEGKRVFFE